jgi:hypothetical protein
MSFAQSKTKAKNKALSKPSNSEFNKRKIELISLKAEKDCYFPLPPLSISAPNPNLAIVESSLLLSQLLAVHFQSQPGNFGRKKKSHLASKLQSFRVVLTKP